MLVSLFLVYFGLVSRLNFSQLHHVEFSMVDMNSLSFEKQIRLISHTSIIVGVHGAGIGGAMHMPIGTKYCCGVIEIFPPGEHMAIRGYGNMARRMGHHYERLEINGGGSDGSYVPKEKLLSLTQDIMNRINGKSSCVLPTVLSDPYFLNGNI